MKEQIICSAVRRNEKIWRGHRHSDAIRSMHDELGYTMSRKDIQLIRAEQGFMTSENRFVDRVEAMNIQVAAGIPSVLKGDQAYLGGELYSEDLY